MPIEWKDWFSLRRRSTPRVSVNWMIDVEVLWSILRYTTSDYSPKILARRGFVCREVMRIACANCSRKMGASG